MINEDRIDICSSAFLGYILPMLFVFSMTQDNHYSSDSKYTIHFDKSFYVTGEVIWYKIYLPQKFEGHKVCFGAHILDSKGATVAQTFLNNKGKLFINGYYKIPLTLESGMYQLLLNGTNNQNLSLKNLLAATIPIYNDLEQKVSGVITAPNPEQNPLENHTTQLNIYLKWHQDFIHTRDKVQATILIEDKDGNPITCNLSVAVTDDNLTGGNVLARPSIRYFSTKKVVDPVHLNSDLSFLGTLSTESGISKKNTLLGLYSFKEKQLDYVVVYDDAKVYFDLQEFYGTKPIHFLEVESDDIRLTTSASFELAVTEPLPSSAAIMDYLELGRKRKKVYQYHNKMEVEIEEFEEYSLDVDYKDYRYIRMSDYDSFEDLPTFLNEVRSPLKLKKKKDGKFKADFFVAKHGAIQNDPKPPLFILDGKMTRDANFIANLDLTQIKDLRMFKDLPKLQRQFGTLGQFGVTIINTLKGDYELPELAQNDYFNVVGYQRPVTLAPVVVDSKISSPILRPLIYWNADLTTDPNGSADFSFNHTDDQGDFKIVIVAQSTSGEIGYKTWVYHAEYNKY